MDRLVLARGALTLASLLMLVSGCYLQIAGPQSALAESISNQGTIVLVAEEIRHAESMECTARVFTETERSLLYGIEWKTPGQARAHTLEQQSNRSKTLRISEGRILLIDHNENSRFEFTSFDQIEDPEIRLIGSFLSPLRLVGLLAGRWQLEQLRHHGDYEPALLMISLSDDGERLEIVVDSRTYLPVKFRKSLADPKLEGAGARVEVEFKWSRQVSPQPSPARPK